MDVFSKNDKDNPGDKEDQQEDEEEEKQSG